MIEININKYEGERELGILRYFPTKFAKVFLAINKR